MNIMPGSTTLFSCIVVLVLLLLYGEYPDDNVLPCAVKEFDSQVQRVLVDEMLTPEEVHNISVSFTDLQDMLQSRWGGADIFVYGSLLIGLGAKTSDVDVYARIPDYSITADKQLVAETAKLLQGRPDKYSNIKPLLNTIVPQLNFFDIAKQRYIDLSFRSYDGVANSKLIAYFLNLDQRYTPLTALIKLWCKVHKLTVKGMLKNYSIYLMVVFYLQQKKMIPSGFDIQVHLPPFIIDGWNVNFEEMPYNVANNESLYELLGGFFKYYSEFNFQKYCVSPFVGRPIAKSDFRDLSSIPKEFTMFRNKFENGDNHSFKINNDMCVQKTYEHNINVVKKVKNEGFVKFINQLKTTAKMYDKLPCDQFLKFILNKD